MSTNDESLMFAQTLKLIKERTGATAVYIGEKIQVPDDPEKQALEWIAATDESSFIVGRTLVNEGVTFDLYKEVEDLTAKVEMSALKFGHQSGRLLTRTLSPPAQ